MEIPDELPVRSSGLIVSQAADIEIQAKEILFIRALLCEYIADYTGQAPRPTPPPPPPPPPRTPRP